VTHRPLQYREKYTIYTGLVLGTGKEYCKTFRSKIDNHQVTKTIFKNRIKNKIYNTLSYLYVVEFQLDLPARKLSPLQHTLKTIPCMISLQSSTPFKSPVSLHSCNVIDYSYKKKPNSVQYTLT
jgi:hypothetical protein